MARFLVAGLGGWKISSMCDLQGGLSIWIRCTEVIAGVSIFWAAVTLTTPCPGQHRHSQASGHGSLIGARLGSLGPFDATVDRSVCAAISAHGSTDHSTANNVTVV
jgi:hypothetical protein